MTELEEIISGHRPWWIERMDAESLMAQLPDRSVDIVFTDPPFSGHVHAMQRRLLRGAGGRAPNAQRADVGLVGEADLGFSALSPQLRRRCSAEFARLTKSWAIVKCDLDEGMGLWRARMLHAGMRWYRGAVWVKGAPQPQLSGKGPGAGAEGLAIAHAAGPIRAWNAGGKAGVYHVAIATDRNQTQSRIHTTQMPEELALQILIDFAWPGDLVLDPFCGSGTIGAACLRLGLRYIGCDSDAGAGPDTKGRCQEPYADAARRRLELVEAEGPEGMDPRGGSTARMKHNLELGL